MNSGLICGRWIGILTRKNWTGWFHYTEASSFRTQYSRILLLWIQLISRNYLPVPRNGRSLGHFHIPIYQTSPSLHTWLVCFEPIAPKQAHSFDLHFWGERRHARAYYDIGEYLLLPSGKDNKWAGKKHPVWFYICGLIVVMWLLSLLDSIRMTANELGSNSWGSQLRARPVTFTFVKNILRRKPQSGLQHGCGLTRWVPFSLLNPSNAQLEPCSPNAGHLECWIRCEKSYVS